MVQRMSYYSEEELHREGYAETAFAGEPGRQAMADTLEDFGADKLHWESFCVPTDLQDKWEALLQCAEQMNSPKDADEQQQQMLLEKYMNSYFDLVESLISDISASEGSSDQLQLLRLLDIIMRWRCCLVSREDSLMIPESHPMEQAVGTLNQWLSKAQEEKNGSLTWEILENRKKRYSSYMIYTMDQIYLRTEKKERNARVGVPFYDAEKLTEISSIRLIEKVEHFSKIHPDWKEKGSIRIACLGEIIEPDALGEYFQAASSGIKVELVQLKHDKSASGLSFSVSQNNLQHGLQNEEREERKIFNLLKPADLEVLFGQYDIILFMDEGCFYSQGQEDKFPAERKVLPQLAWSRETACREQKKENKILYYQQAYRTVGEWLNGWDSDKTAKLQFNRKLLWAIQSAMKPEYEVYLYVSFGKQVSDQELFYRDVCNDEKYDGKELLVCKVPFEKRDMSAEVERLLDFEGNKSIIIDFWKLIKSIGNQYYQEFLSRAEIEDEYQGIRLLKDTALMISWENNSEDGRGRLSFTARTSGEEAYCNQVNNFMIEVLQAGFTNVEFSCVKEYLHRLLGDAVISRAMDVDGILIGYLLRGNYFDLKMHWGGVQGEDKENLDSDLKLFEPRRMVLFIIDNLSKVWIRDYEKKEDYLMYEFRSKYCPRLSEAVFKRLLAAVNRTCEEIGYTDSRLYNHSKL